MVFSSTDGRTSSAGKAGFTTGFVLYVLLAPGSLPVFWLGFVDLLDAWGRPEYSHGPLIPLISLYLFLREMRSLPAAPRAAHGRAIGVALVIFSLSVAMLGNVARIPDIVTYGFILWLGGLVIVQFGWARGRLHMLPVFHLIFMLPLPQFVYWNLTTVNGGVKFGHCGGAKVGQFGASALERAALI
ncbi:archaeosortase/exosortase family protein [Donghicola sp. XS_ASV15]|uniref:archaeosortase/exosortase family protein n=1 Tax=Donghicola sp. XS_ASV15 TaxID=3241295 RepID=UPI003518D02C